MVVNNIENELGPWYGHKEGIYLYGDPSGKSEDANGEQGENFFTTMQDELKRYNPELRMLSKAPALKTNGEWINEIFQSNSGGIKLFINNNCKETIKDLLYLKIDGNGGTFKEKIKDIDKVQIEKYGHTSDSMRYFLTAFFEDEYSIHKNPPKDFEPLRGGIRKTKHGYK